MSSYNSLLLFVGLVSWTHATVTVSDAEKRQLDDIIAEYLAVPSSDMWATEPEISSHHPFIFFHIRKAGGTSLRQTIKSAADKAGLASFIPCLGGVGCDTYHFPPGTNNSVFAGHFYYGEQHMFSRFDQGERERHFSCMTNFREPVSRFASCIYFRFHTPCINSLSLKELDMYIHKLDSYGDSCMNEPFAIMSGLQDRTITDHLEESDHAIARRLGHLRGLNHSGSYKKRSLLERDAVAIFDMTLQHVKRCAPVVLELPDSHKLQTRRFPKLGNLGAFRETFANADKKAHDCEPPSGDHLQLIQEHTYLETLLYNAVFQKVNSSLAELFASNGQKE